MINRYKIVAQMSLEEMLAQYSLIYQLNPRLKEMDFLESIQVMQALPYRMLGIFEGSRCVAVSGYWVLTKLYAGKYLEMDNVVVDQNHRSMGLGKMMCDTLELIAREEGCKVMMLDAYMDNEKGHVFYEREGFEKKGYHFVKSLKY